MFSDDIGVNCVCDKEDELLDEPYSSGRMTEAVGEHLIIKNIMEEEIMETTINRELTYNDYLQMIQDEEERIEEIENEIEEVNNQLEDVELSIELEEAERLNNLKVLYEETVARRKQGQERLEKLETKLEDRRNYLYSLSGGLSGGLRQNNYVAGTPAPVGAKEYESRKDILEGNIENNSTYTSNNITKTYF